jgi:hypothetical protein
MQQAPQRGSPGFSHGSPRLYRRLHHWQTLSLEASWHARTEGAVTHASLVTLYPGKESVVLAPPFLAQSLLQGVTKSWIPLGY